MYIFQPMLFKPIGMMKTSRTLFRSALLIHEMMVTLRESIQHELREGKPISPNSVVHDLWWVKV